MVAVRNEPILGNLIACWVAIIRIEVALCSIKVKVGLTLMRNLLVMVYPHDKLKLASDGSGSLRLAEHAAVLSFGT